MSATTYTDQQIHEWLKYADAVASGRVAFSEKVIDVLVHHFTFESPFARPLAVDAFRNLVRVVLNSYTGEYAGGVIETLRLLYENREE